MLHDVRIDYVTIIRKYIGRQSYMEDLSMKQNIRDALLELQGFHMHFGNANKVAAIESLLNDFRNPTWYDFYCVKRAVKEYISFYCHEVRRLHQKGSEQMIKVGKIIHSLEQVCRYINMYRQSILVGGYLETFDEYFSEEDL